MAGRVCGTLHDLSAEPASNQELEDEPGKQDEVLQLDGMLRGKAARALENDLSAEPAMRVKKARIPDLQEGTEERQELQLKLQHARLQLQHQLKVQELEKQYQASQTYLNMQLKEKEKELQHKLKTQEVQYQHQVTQIVLDTQREAKELEHKRMTQELQHQHQVSLLKEELKQKNVEVYLLKHQALAPAAVPVAPGGRGNR
jgi:hypothetical protein